MTAVKQYSSVKHLHIGINDKIKLENDNRIAILIRLIAEVTEAVFPELI